MFHILGFLFVIIIAVLLIGLSIVGSVLRSIFGFGGHRSSNAQRENNKSGGYSYNKQQSESSQGEVNPEEGEIHPKHKKLFAKDEGEYVDFEEIKE